MCMKIDEIKYALKTGFKINSKQHVLKTKNLSKQLFNFLNFYKIYYIKS